MGSSSITEQIEKIAIETFASDDVIMKWREQVLATERQIEQVLDKTNHTNHSEGGMEHTNSYTNIPSEYKEGHSESDYRAVGYTQGSYEKDVWYNAHNDTTGGGGHM